MKKILATIALLIALANAPDYTAWDEVELLSRGGL